MQLDLSQEEAVALRECLAASLKDLPSEIRHTDSPTFRISLRLRRELLQRISDRLAASDAA